MKILGHRHTGIIVHDLERMLNFYVGIGLVLRCRDIEKGEFIDGLIGVKEITLETVKLVLEDVRSPIGYSFQLELMKVITPHKTDSRTARGNFDFLKRSSGVLDIAFTVDDVIAVNDFILLNGGDIIGTPLRSTSGFPALHCYVRDPEGNVLHLAQNLSAQVK
jgi:catechol 2,3-dioxygenase-like lactoylglutathione lyase family enzyme